jgi:Fe-S cluster assembly iron-binding protein IscA
MITSSPKALEMLRKHLVRKCSDAGIGFRVLRNADEPDKVTYSIMLDRKHQEDNVVDMDGIKVFVESAITSHITDYQIDYLDEPDGGFVLNKRA